MTVRRLIVSVLLLLLLVVTGCTPTTAQLLTFEAQAASTTVLLTGEKPWAIDSVQLPSTTEWTLYRIQSWGRSFCVKNLDETDPLYVGNYDETGVFAGIPTDDLTVLSAGEAHCPPLYDGGAQLPDSAHFLVPLASTTALHEASFTISTNWQ